MNLPLVLSSRKSEVLISGRKIFDASLARYLFSILIVLIVSGRKGPVNCNCGHNQSSI